MRVHVLNMNLNMLILIQFDSGDHIHIHAGATYLFLFLYVLMSAKYAGYVPFGVISLASGTCWRNVKAKRSTLGH